MRWSMPCPISASATSTCRRRRRLCGARFRRHGRGKRRSRTLPAARVFVASENVIVEICTFGKCCLPAFIDFPRNIEVRVGSAAGEGHIEFLPVGIVAEGFYCGGRHGRFLVLLCLAKSCGRPSSRTAALVVLEIM